MNYDQIAKILTREIYEELSGYYKRLVTNSNKEIEKLKAKNRTLQRRIHDQRVEIKHLIKLRDELKDQKQEIIKWKEKH